MADLRLQGLMCTAGEFGIIYKGHIVKDKNKLLLKLWL